MSNLSRRSFMGAALATFLLPYTLTEAEAKEPDPVKAFLKRKFSELLGASILLDTSRGRVISPCQVIFELPNGFQLTSVLDWKMSPITVMGATLGLADGTKPYGAHQFNSHINLASGDTLRMTYNLFLEQNVKYGSMGSAV